jgi:hypothetical protein
MPGSAAKSDMEDERKEADRYVTDKLNSCLLARVTTALSTSTVINDFSSDLWWYRR